MSFFSNVPETSGRYGGHVAKFKELFRKHEVSFGKTEDFFQLAPKLAYDGEFRAEFAGLTESIRKREDGKLTLTRMLTIIAIAMGGPEIETLGSASAVPISLVVVFLAGVGGWSETEPEIVTKAPREEPSGGVKDLAADRSVAVGSKQEEEREVEAPEQRLANGPSHNLSELRASLFAGPALVKEALKRAELNTLELKHHLDSIDPRIEQIEHPDQIASKIEPPPDVRLRSEGDGQPRRIRPAVQFTQPELVAPSLEELAAVEASFRARKLPEIELFEADASNVPDRSAVEAMLRAAELKSAEPIEEQVPVAVGKSVGEAILRAAELEKAERAEVNAPIVADRYEAETTPHSSEPPKDEVVAPLVDEREVVEAKVLSVGPLVEPPKVEAVPIVAPVVIADRYESVRVQRLHRMIAALGVLLFLLVEFAAALLYRDRDWLVQTLVKNRRVNAAPFASDGKGGLPPPDRGGGTSGNVPTQWMQTSPVVTPQREAESSGNVGQGESGGWANGPTDSGSNRKVQDQTVMNHAEARGQAKQAPLLESAPAKIPSTKQEAPPAVPGGLELAARGDVPGGSPVRATLSKPPPVTASEAHIFRINSWAMSKNLIDSPKPTYPIEARFQRVEGDVLVRVLISENGMIERATAVTGPQPLRAAAESAMRQWRYKPYIADGKPIKVQTEINFHFSLKPE